MNKTEEEIHREHQQQIFQIFEAEPFAQSIGLKIIEIGEGTAQAEIQVEEHMYNTHGTVHGAIIFALADYTFAAACNSYGKTAVGLSTTVNFIAPAKKGDKLIAIAREEKRNHRLGWYKIDVLCNQDLIATMEAIAYRKKDFFVKSE